MSAVLSVTILIRGTVFSLTDNVEASGARREGDDVDVNRDGLCEPATKLQGYVRADVGTFERDVAKRNECHQKGDVGNLL